MVSGQALFATFRLKTEIQSIQLPLGASLSAEVSKEDGYAMEIGYTMQVAEGIYEGRTLQFCLRVPNTYPFRPPKLRCLNDVFHPNIDDDGNVCMEILRLGWRPSHGLESIFANLYVIFVDVTGDDALNTQAGDLFKSDREKFVRVARGQERI